MATNNIDKAKAALSSLSAQLGGSRGMTSAERITKLQNELRSGQYVAKNKKGEEVARSLSAAAQLKKVVQLVKAEAEVPTEVGGRFDWATARDSVAEYATAKGVDPDAVLAAVGVAKPNGATKAKPTRSGKSARA